VAVKTGFIGLGAMGSPMASNLIKAGIPVVVYDIDPEKCRRIEAQGAQAATSPAEVAREATRIICMVETTAQVRTVMTGLAGVMEVAREGHLIACMSTIAPKEIKDLHDELGRSGVVFIDAPVSGGIERAIAGTLSVFASGNAIVLEAFRDAFDSIGNHVFAMGDVGQGMAMKLVNNMLVQINSVAVAEAMLLGTKAGLDPQMIYDVIKVSTGYSVAFEMRAPRMIARNFAPGGIMDISYKDQELETTFAKQLGVPMFLAAVTQQIYQIGRNIGLSKEDASAIIKVYEKFGGPPPT
jgi:3-hydroxyisobutyrate dehydrogenase-like beta-hydroxyacid dehydrogenase